MLDPEFDIVSSTFHADPAHTIESIRALSRPFVKVRLPILGRMLLCVTHEASGAILKDKAFVRDPANAGSRIQEQILSILPRSIGLLALNMLGKDDPEHRHLRGLVDKAFQRQGIEAVRPFITAAADQLLDGLPKHREVDLLENFCRDLRSPLFARCWVCPTRTTSALRAGSGGLRIPLILA